MKLVFVPDPEVHSHQVRFPIRFVVAEELSVASDLNFSGIPPVVVYANTVYERQLSADLNFEVKPRIGGYLQVKCRADQDGVVAGAIKAALIAFNAAFGEYEVEARFEITPLSEHEIAESDRYRKSLVEAGW